MLSQDDSQDNVARYRKLLSLARSSLESNQASLAAKDKQISELIAALEEERQNNHKRNGNDENSIPRCLLRRIDLVDAIWILVEYEEREDEWKKFKSEVELDDFIQRLNGAPLQKPQRCLSPEESVLIEEECKKRVDRVVEEFRRYKVRTEIARKQRDVESKQVLLRGSLGNHLSSDTPLSIDPSLSSDATYWIEEVKRLRTQLSEQETKWKTALEQASKENEQLRTRGSDVLLASQWRDRYETCHREKEELAEKLRVYSQVSSEYLQLSLQHSTQNHLHSQLPSQLSISAPTSRPRPPGRGVGRRPEDEHEEVSSHFQSLLGIGSGKSLEQAYLELMEEYKDFKQKVLVAEKQRKAEEEALHAASSAVFSGRTDLSDPSSSPSLLSDSISRGHEGLMTIGMGEAKIQYIRQMSFQYLSCRDSEVKHHIEAALVAIFRFNEKEKQAIEERRKEESQDTLTSLSNFFSVGSLTN